MRVEIGILALLLVFAITITSKKVTESEQKPKETEKSGAASSKITNVLPNELSKLVEDNEYLLVFFYDDDDKKSQISKQVIRVNILPNSLKVEQNTYHIAT